MKLSVEYDDNLSVQKVNEWSFDPFDLNEVSQGHALKYIGFEMFNRYGFLERFKAFTFPP